MKARAKIFDMSLVNLYKDLLNYSHWVEGAQSEEWQMQMSMRKAGHIAFETLLLLGDPISNLTTIGMNLSFN